LPSQELAPLWLLVLWAAYALIINGCMSWLHERYILAATLGAIGAPLSYLGGIKLGAADTTQTALALVVISLIFAAVTPLLLYLSKKFSTPNA
jgi:hypothetical protein